MIVRAAFGLKTWKPPKIEINKRTTIVVDECSMADNEKLKKVLDHAQRNGCRVVLLGDQRQLPAIQQGGLFREIYERAAPAREGKALKNVRQREAWTKGAIESFGRGEIRAALQAYRDRGFMHVEKTRAEAMDRTVQKWSEPG